MCRRERDCNFFDQWSAVSQAELMSDLAMKYADNVDYYGAKTTLRNVLADKKRWLQWWPIQNYQVRLESMIIGE
jgi:hypothetical protein